MRMARSNTLMQRYQSADSVEERAAVTRSILRQAVADESLLPDILIILNEENNSVIRLSIIRFLRSARPLSAIRALTKEMFDPDPLIRAQAAEAVAEYDDAVLLAPSLAALLDAVPDPATRAPAERAILRVTGRSSDKISISEKRRIKLGEHAQKIWPEHFTIREGSR